MPGNDPRISDKDKSHTNRDVKQILDNLRMASAKRIFTKILVLILLIGMCIHLQGIGLPVLVQAYSATPASAKTYTVTFTESGLASGTSWSVIFNGKAQTSRSTSITFSNVKNGRYSFSVSTPSGYSTSSQTSGTITVSGAKVTKTTTFIKNDPIVGTYTLTKCNANGHTGNYNDPRIPRKITFYNGGKGAYDLPSGEHHTFTWRTGDTPNYKGAQYTVTFDTKYSGEGYSLYGHGVQVTSGCSTIWIQCWINGWGVIYTKS